VDRSRRVLEPFILSGSWMGLRGHLLEARGSVRVWLGTGMVRRMRSGVKRVNGRVRSAGFSSRPERSTGNQGQGVGLRLLTRVSFKCTGMEPTGRRNPILHGKYICDCKFIKKSSFNLS